LQTIFQRHQLGTISGPGFYPLNPFLPTLTLQDAKFVDIIHSDSLNFGANVSTGHADFWPNGGKLQPNCPTFDNSNFLNPASMFFIS
jgi:hypothetical protein